MLDPVEESLQLGGGQALRRADLRQHLPVADIAAFQEIGLEQRLGHRFLQLFVIGKADHPVRIHRVGGALDLLEIERNVLAAADPADGVVDLPGAHLAAELGFDIGLAVHAFLRHAGVQLEGAPADFEGRHRPQLQRALQSALADITPGADHVGENIEAHGCSFPAHFAAHLAA